MPGFFSALLFSLVICLPAMAQDCVLRKEEDSIKVFTCSDEQFRFKSIRARFEMKAHLSDMAAVVTDVENYIHWQFNTINSKILQRTSDHEFIYYIEVEAPWPISNRDLVVRFTIQQDTSTLAIKITANGVPDFIPPVDGLVRVPSSASQWIISPEGSDKISISYSIQIDPGGAVPAWLANRVAAQAPWESFHNLKRRMRRMPPGGKTLSFITNSKPN